MLRKMTRVEAMILDRLLSRRFTGRDELRAQLRNARVSVLDENGSLAIVVGDDAPVASVDSTVPVEGYFATADSVVHVLLHVQSGYLNELETYLEDLSVVPPISEDDVYRMQVSSL